MAVARSGSARTPRWDTPARLAGAAVGLAVNVVVSLGSASRVDLLHGALALGLCVMAGVFAADVAARPGPGWTRMAGLTPRRIRDYVPRSLAVSLVAQAAVLSVLLIVAVVTAATGEGGRPAGALSGTCPGGARPFSPWPGAGDVWPALGGLVLGTVACALLLRRVVARAGGDEQRRVNARAAVAAWGMTVSVPLLVVSLTMARGLPTPPCAGMTTDVPAQMLAFVALAAAVTAAHCLCVVMLPQAYLGARR
ncbi:hypothetical protein [Streptomyces zhihengii]|uniref:hypothetical protein n=1 Tax=Streptomyces zhihengii TaxID=1818004 RepID=UPI0033B89393